MSYFPSVTYSHHPEPHPYPPSRPSLSSTHHGEDYDQPQQSDYLSSQYGYHERGAIPASQAYNSQTHLMNYAQPEPRSLSPSAYPLQPLFTPGHIVDPSLARYSPDPQPTVYPPSASNYSAGGTYAHGLGQSNQQTPQAGWNGGANRYEETRERMMRRRVRGIQCRL
jgi:hypothetical protein